MNFYTILIFKPEYGYYREATPNNLIFTTSMFQPPTPRREPYQGLSINYKKKYQGCNIIYIIKSVITSKFYFYVIIFHIFKSIIDLTINAMCYLCNFILCLIETP